MSPSLGTSGRLKLLAAIILISLVSTGFGIGYYFSAAGNGPPVTWNINPLQINLTVPPGTASASDSFTCSSTITPVTLQVSSSDPQLVNVSVTPDNFSTCGSTPDNVQVTATCSATSVPSGTCGGETQFHGTVIVCGPTSYQCVGRPLSIAITVAGSNGQQ